MLRLAPSRARAAIGVAIAIAVTATMDATGLTVFSALPLLPLLALFAWLERLPPKVLGFVWGRGGDYLIALLHPGLVMGTIAAIAATIGLVHPVGVDWGRVCLNIARGSVVGTIVVSLTEEGFFRGWLWASLERTGLSRGAVLIATSLAFMLWHISAVTLPTGFNPPPPQVPVFLVNAVAMGLVWGLIRMRSGSLVASSLCHSTWNAIAYILFGFGEKVGKLGIRETGIYGPEVGGLGLALNVAFAALLWQAVRRAAAPAAVAAPPS